MNKKHYTSPTITIESIKIEHSIAAGSAQVIPFENNEANHHWDNNITDDRELYW